MEKVILFLDGGAMTGVFGAGVIYELGKLKIYPKIKTVYGSSAGVFNMAYFLAGDSVKKQLDIGASIYWENLQRHFMFPEKTFFGIIERIWNRYLHRLPRRKIMNVTNIDYLMDVAQHKKILDLNALSKSPVRGFAKMFDTKTNKIVYKDLKKNTFETMKEAVSVIPHYVPRKKQRYVDGGIVDGRGGYDYLRKKYPKDKIIICINFRPETLGVFSTIQHFFEGFVAYAMYPKTNLFSRFANKNKDFREEIYRIKKDKNALLIFPPKNNPVFVGTLDPKKLKKSFKLGRKKAKKVLEFIS